MKEDLINKLDYFLKGESNVHRDLNKPLSMQIIGKKYYAWFWREVAIKEKQGKLFPVISNLKSFYNLKFMH